ncbi:MAG: DUF502 domain-containing protein [Candidatus Margulisbacteria bacterium]|nr:DUF502 domain-containing protein [Candidatus Margulisiibacteriota bacterium]
METHAHKEGLQIRLGKYFINGLILLFPLFVTIYALQVIVNFADNLLTTPFKVLPWEPPPYIGLIVSIFLIIIVGYFTTNVFITRIFRWAEKLMFKVPIVKSIYSTAKQINEMLFLQKEKNILRRVCLIPYPHPGVYTVAFLTNEAPQVINNITGKQLLNVFVPSTPTPATGFLVLVPKDQVILLDISLDDALKLIVSGGVISKQDFKQVSNSNKG